MKENKRALTLKKVTVADLSNLHMGSLKAGEDRTSVTIGSYTHNCTCGTCMGGCPIYCTNDVETCVCTNGCPDPQITKDCPITQ